MSLFKRLVSLLVSTFFALGYPVIDHVVDSTGKVHVACVDIGPTLCADGSIFSDWQPESAPFITERSDLP